MHMCKQCVLGLSLGGRVGGGGGLGDEVRTQYADYERVTSRVGAVGR